MDWLGGLSHPLAILNRKNSDFKFQNQDQDARAISGQSEKIISL